MRADLPGTLRLHARLAVSAVNAAWLETHRRDIAAVLNPPPEVVSARCEGPNITCTAGLTAFAGALVWSGIEDQAANLGVTSATWLAPLYGALGSGTGTVAASDTALFSELGRQAVGAGASSPATPSIPATAVWLFYFPPPSSSWTVTEAGVFAGAASAAGSGTLLDHYLLGSPVTITSPDTGLLQMSLSVAGS